MPHGTLRTPIPLAGIEVSVTIEGSAMVVALRGEADIATLPVIADILARSIADHDGDVIIDLAQTDFIDTAALRAILRARETLSGAGRQLTLRSPSRTASRALTIFGLGHLASLDSGPEGDDVLTEGGRSLGVVGDLALGVVHGHPKDDGVIDDRQLGG